MADVQQLRRTMARIEAHPEQHNQASWHCGSKQCFGGWTCTLNGYQFTGEPDDYEYVLVINPVTGAHELAEIVAQRLLGLTDREADWLFYACETLADVRAYVTVLVMRYGP